MKKKNLTLLFVLLFLRGLAAPAAQVATPAEAAGLQGELEIRAALERTSPEGDTARVIRGILYHNLAQLQGEVDEAAVEKGLAELDEDLAESNSVALAYRGSLVTLQASLAEASGNLFGAAALLERGFAAMDKAVEIDPDNYLIRCLRGVNSVQVSQGSPFDQCSQAEEDLAWLTANPASQTGTAEQAMILWLKGEVAYRNRRLDEALSAWEEAYDTAPDSLYGRESDERLWELEE